MVIINVNGKTTRFNNASNINISRNRVIVDGKQLDTEMRSYGDNTITITGDVAELTCEGSVEIHGNCGSVRAGGNVHIGEYVNGSINAGGNIHCGDVSGSINAGGNVHCRS